MCMCVCVSCTPVQYAQTVRLSGNRKGNEWPGPGGRIGERVRTGTRVHYEQTVRLSAMEKLALTRHWPSTSLRSWLSKDSCGYTGTHARTVRKGGCDTRVAHLAVDEVLGEQEPARPLSRGAHSSTSRLDVSTFCCTRWMVSLTETAQIEGDRRFCVHNEAPGFRPGSHRLRLM